MGKCLFMRKGETHSAPSNGILASELVVGSSVYLNENGSPVEYLVVNQGIPSSSSFYDVSCNGTWLLRKDIYELRAWDSSDNDYRNSDIHAYLNSTFLNLFDAKVQSAVKQVKIPYHKGTGSNGVAFFGSDGLDTKVFLLDGHEIGWTTSQYITKHGDCLEYFVGTTNNEPDPKRFAYFNGTVTIWWTRSPHRSTTNSTMTCDPTTVYDYNGLNVKESHGVRPALILPSNAVFDKNTLVLKGVA